MNWTETDLEGGPGGCLEDLPDALLALGGALEVGEGVDLLGHRPTLLRLHRLLLHLPQLLDRVRVVPQVLLHRRKISVSWFSMGSTLDRFQIQTKSTY